MRSRKTIPILAATIVLCLYMTVFASAECLDCEKCSQLIRLAQKHQQDLKAVSMVLGSAVESGSLERIRAYKLRKGSTRRELDKVMRAIELRGCLKHSPGLP
jgi:predicted dithiol-disulfide oxidoreductase (DUF899 family)